MVKELLQNKRVMEIFRFGVTGGVGFVIDAGILFALTEWANLYYLVSAAISFTISVVVNYLLCRLWVFEVNAKTAQSKKSLFLFVGSSIIGLFLNQLFMWLFVDIFRFYYMIAKVIATLLVMIWNYIMKRKALAG